MQNAADRGAAAARDAIPWAQRIQQGVHSANMSEANRHAVVQAAANARHNAAIAKASDALAAVRAQGTTLGQIRDKKTSTIVHVTNQISISEWQRTVISSIRANSTSGGFI